MTTLLMLHHLRNPYGVDEIEMRKARLKAADELERLYAAEEELKERLNTITTKLSDYLK